MHTYCTSTSKRLTRNFIVSDRHINKGMKIEINFIEKYLMKYYQEIHFVLLGYVIHIKCIAYSILNVLIRAYCVLQTVGMIFEIHNSNVIPKIN